MKKLIFLSCIFVMTALIAPMAMAQSYGNSDSSYKNSVNTTKIGAKHSSKYGWYLVDAGGRTLYMFKADRRHKGSDCYGGCAEVWPPLLTSGNPRAISDKVNSKMLGTIKRSDGTMQVTYNGWPLYYYVRDHGEEKFNGQDVKGFGAEWYIMSPNGSYIHLENKMKIQMMEINEIHIA